MGPRTLTGSAADATSRHDGVGSAPEMLRQHRDILVIRPDGRLDADAIERVGQIVAAESTTAAIVDLDECFLSDPEALAAIDGTVLNGVELCNVTGRMSCRRLLVRAGVTDRFPVFQRRRDALQARQLATEGSGRGWSMP